MHKHHKTNGYHRAWEFLCLPFITNKSSLERLNTDYLPNQNPPTVGRKETHTFCTAALLHGAGLPHKIQ
jgi:hypothetical protein